MSNDIYERTHAHMKAYRLQITTHTLYQFTNMKLFDKGCGSPLEKKLKGLLDIFSKKRTYM